LPEPRSSPTPHFDGQRALSGRAARLRVRLQGAQKGRSPLLALLAIRCALRTKTGQESWAEFLERGDWGDGAVDYDDVRVAGPEFGWNMTEEPLVHVIVPPPIASDGGMLISGVQRSFRRIGTDVVVEASRREAAQLLSNQVWRQLNPGAANELFGEG
jgi:hypothetical protein